MNKSDVLIIGSGIAGCTTALVAADGGLKVTLLTAAGAPDDCNTARAQGGIVYREADVAPGTLEEDIWQAGVGKGQRQAIRQLVTEGPACVEAILLRKLKVPFDQDASRQMHLTQEGGHSRARIIHVADRTGREIQNHLVQAVSEHPNIEVKQGQTAIDLLTTDHSTRSPESIYEPQVCFGAYVFDNQTRQVTPYVASQTILATGGVGGLYLHTTNSSLARGDGIAMASRVGARIVNMEFIQFHPTGLFHPHQPRRLLTEALRGEGATLLNHQGNAFMEKYHPMGNLAPRDVAARAIADQMMLEAEQFVYLDISHKDGDWVRERFPEAVAVCASYGYDLTQGPVPVVPVAHYTCGGILVDAQARTSIHRLRAVGEVSCTGVHGANRLASTSLLECLVWGVSCGRDILASAKDRFNPPTAEPWNYEHEFQDPGLIHQDWQTIRNTMWNYVGPTRSPKRLRRANAILNNLRLEIEEFYDEAELSVELIGLRNGVQAALVVLRHAMANTISAGCHYYQKTG